MSARTIKGLPVLLRTILRIGGDAFEENYIRLLLSISVYVVATKIIRISPVDYTLNLNFNSFDMPVENKIKQVSPKLNAFHMMNHQHFMRLCLALIMLTVVSLTKLQAQHEFRALTTLEAAFYNKVNATIEKAFPAQVGSLKLINVNQPEANTKSKTMLADHPVNKGEYVLFYSFEYGKAFNDIRADSKLEDKISEALNTGDETKERALMEQLAKMVGEQRIYVDVAVNFGLLNFNYVKGSVQTLPIKDAVAYRCLFAEDPMSNVPYMPGTYIGVGTYDAPKNMPYDGNEGGVFEVLAKQNKSLPDMSIQNVQIKIQGAPAIADQLVKQIDIAGLKAILGSKLVP